MTWDASCNRANRTCPAIQELYPLAGHPRSCCVCFGRPDGVLPAFPGGQRRVDRDRVARQVCCEVDRCHTVLAASATSEIEDLMRSRMISAALRCAGHAS